MTIGTASLGSFRAPLQQLHISALSRTVPTIGGIKYTVGGLAMAMGEDLWHVQSDALLLLHR